MPDRALIEQLDRAIDGYGRRRTDLVRRPHAFRLDGDCRQVTGFAGRQVQDATQP